VRPLDGGVRVQRLRAFVPDSLPPEVVVPQTAPAPIWGALDASSGAVVPPALGGVVEDEGLDWARWWSVLVRFRWWVVLGTTVGLAAGLVAARLLKPLYLTQATIWIDAGNRGPDATRGPIRSGQLFESYAWVDLLRSFTVLDAVVRQQRLYVTPRSAADAVALASFDVADDFRPGRYRVAVDATGRELRVLGPRGELLQRVAVGDSVGVPLGFRWVPTAAALPPRASVAFSLVTLRDAAQRLSDALRVHLDENGNFLRLELSGTDPARLATTLNAVAQRYVAVAADLKRAKLVELTRILDEQLATAAGNLRAAESSLESFRVKTITLPSERATPVAPGLEQTRDPVFANFFEMRIEREQLRRDQEAIQRVLADLPDSGGAERGGGAGVAALEVIGSVQRSAELSSALRELTAKQAELRALRYRYAEAYPPVERLAGEVATLERRTIPELARTLLAQIATREQVIDSLVHAAGQELQQIPQRAVEEARLRREVTIAENLYTTLQQRYEEARLAEASTIPDVRVLDAAVAPHQPIRNTAPRLVLLGLFGGLGVSVVGAVLLDRIDRRVRYPQQVTRDLGLGILGVVPRLKQRRGRPDPADAAQVVEAFRTVRLNLAHAYGTAGPIIFTISSPGPGDGKSFLSGHLARAFADTGRRTLLIDGDTRRGVLHRTLRTRRKPGLLDLLAGMVSPDQIIQATDHPCLWFIGGGTRKADAPELLGAPPMGQLLAWTRTAYDVILVDSPPLGAGVDPYLLGTLTGNLVLVLRTGTTDRDLAHAKLDVLARLPIRLLGAVLNDVEPKGAYRYYGYVPGYAAENEPTDTERWALSRGLPRASRTESR
jgi:capsular exopolysaccharide synthesis family protein